MTFVTPEAIGVAGAEDPKLQSVAKCAHTHCIYHHLSKGYGAGVLNKAKELQYFTLSFLSRRTVPFPYFATNAP